MKNILYLLAMTVGMTGCAQQLDNRWVHDLIKPSSYQAANYNFDWKITGEPSLAPLQAFDDGKQVWLQFADLQNTPAVFSKTATASRLVFPKQIDKYLVIDHVPEKILLRGGLLVAELERFPAQAVTTASLQVSAAKPDSATVPPPPPLPVEPQPARVNKVTTGPVLIEKQAKNRHTNLIAQAVSYNNHEFNVSPKDQNIRKAIKKWAQAAPWTFTDEHWDVDVDIPLAGSASFGRDFQIAVRDLLAATELGDRPLQPCFYSNKVLRVIALADRCDRTVAAGARL